MIRVEVPATIKHKFVLKNGLPFQIQAKSGMRIVQDISIYQKLNLSNKKIKIDLEL
jgi:hypothetical protein